MKKILSLLALIIILSVGSVSAAPNFSQPILQKAYEQINLRIDQKTSKIILDENLKTTIEQKKAQLWEILSALDTAVKNHNKPELLKQVKLFRDLFKETMIFIQSIGNVNSAPVIHKNIPSTPKIETGWTGKATDITFYADSFEWGKTTNGNTFSQSYFSAAACEIPLNTLVQISQWSTSVVVKVNDRPNCTKHPNLTDLTTNAFKTLGNLSRGKIPGTINALWVTSKNYTKRTLPTDTFKDLWIELDSSIPNTYLKNETFHVTGKELNWEGFTILYMKSPSGKNITLGMEKWWDGRFEYNSPLEEIGTYSLVIASGLGFKTSTFFDITVLDDTLFSAKQLLSPEIPSKQIEKLSVERKELPDFTSFYLFHFSDTLFHTLTLKSDNETFIYRGFGTIAIRGNALKILDTSKPLFVEVTWEKNSTVFSHDTYTKPVIIFQKTMTLTPGFKEEKNENITITERWGELFVRSLVTKGKNVKSDIILTLPNGDVEKYTFDPSSIDTDGFLKRGKVLEKTLSLKQKGLYLVEVNYDNGFAAYNGPIIYGNFLAIYPNENDSAEKKINANDNTIVKKDSLLFVNGVRAKSNKKALSLDDALNNLATIKAQDMASHNNLSHTDSNGEKILGTAKRNNIKIAWGIGENIAWGNINFHLLLIGLANSGGHRANMLDTWTKMGVGYAVKDGQVYYAQVFGE